MSKVHDTLKSLWRQGFFGYSGVFRLFLATFGTLLALVYVIFSSGFCHCPWSGVFLDCIDFWSLPSFMLLKNYQNTYYLYLEYYPNI